MTSTNTPVPSTGGNLKSDGTGTQSDPHVLHIAAPATTAFPLEGTGGFLGAASGTGTESDPWVLAAVSGAADTDYFIPVPGRTQSYVGGDTSMTTTDNYSINIGHNNTNSGPYAYTFGQDDHASGYGAIAIGNSVTASGYGIGIGTDIHAGPTAVSIGSNISSSSNYSVAVGQNALASSNYAVALGPSNTASGKYTAVVGYSSSASADRSQSLGASCTCSGTDALSGGSSTTVASNESVGIGHNINIESSAGSSVAIGKGVHMYQPNSFALGGSQSVIGTFATSIGTDANCWNDYCVAIGDDTWAGDANSFKLLVSIVGTLVTISGDVTAIFHNLDSVLLVGGAAPVVTSITTPPVFAAGNTTFNVGTGSAGATGIWDTQFCTHAAAFGNQVRNSTKNSTEVGIGAHKINVSALGVLFPNNTAANITATSPPDGTMIFASDTFVMYLRAAGAWKIVTAV